MPRARKANGQFPRLHQHWDASRWDDGYIDNKGRFRVYRPDCPRAFGDGYALRAHVVWWLAKEHTHPPGTVLHHRNQDRLDDRIENLDVVGHGDHTRLHHKEPTPVFCCARCQKLFETRKKYDRVIRFCSQRCYHRHPRSQHHREAIAVGLREAYRSGVRG